MSLTSRGLQAGETASSSSLRRERVLHTGTRRKPKAPGSPQVGTFDGFLNRTTSALTAPSSHLANLQALCMWDDHGLPPA
ncbi:hypothetical protein V5799_003915 [Amblyomma americanum]|uniref:Uncharacterized protein n=1 Tax=Amblyomma americanum TaxID=6943 RepID=A0AAQ4D7L3_AMBAM